MKGAKITSQKPWQSGTLDNGLPWEIYEEFGFFTVYVNGKKMSIHETSFKALGKIKYLNESNKEKELDRARTHGTNTLPKRYSERRF